MSFAKRLVNVKPLPTGPVTFQEGKWHFGVRLRDQIVKKTDPVKVCSGVKFKKSRPVLEKNFKIWGQFWIFRGEK